MPKKIEKLEAELKAQAHKKGLKGEAFNRYVWGTVRKVFPGWEPTRTKEGSCYLRALKSLILEK